MKLDQDRIRAVLQSDHSILNWRNIPTRQDNRWGLGEYTDFIARFLTPSRRVLDVSCRRGHILMELSPRFHTGFGIDIDPERLQMAEDAKRAIPLSRELSLASRRWFSGGVAVSSWNRISQALEFSVCKAISSFCVSVDCVKILAKVFSGLIYNG